MRISDWSSDVCSSDLRAHFFRGRGVWKSFLLESGSYSFERRGRSAREFFLERNAKSHSGVCEQRPLRTDRAASDQFRDAPDVVGVAMRNNDKIEIIWRIIASQLLELIRKRCWHPRGAGFVSLVGAVDQNSFAVDFAVGAISVLAVAHVEHSHVHSSNFPHTRSCTTILAASSSRIWCHQIYSEARTMSGYVAALS